MKWPNDVLADGARSRASCWNPRAAARAIRAGSPSASASIWRRFPTDTEFPATSLAALGIARAAAAGRADSRSPPRFAKWYDVWRAHGFAPMRDAWLARAAGLGARIRARLQNEERIGVFEGIDEDGALSCATAQGQRRTIAAGEVFFVRAMKNAARHRRRQHQHRLRRL